MRINSEHEEITYDLKTHFAIISEPSLAKEYIKRCNKK